MKKIFLSFVLLGAVATMAADRHPIIDESQHVSESDSPTRRRQANAELLADRASAGGTRLRQVIPAVDIQRPRTGYASRRMYQCTCACAATVFILTAVSLATTPSMRNFLTGRPL